MYRQHRGPDYYSFTYGGVHFVALNTLMTDDSAYYGRVDSLQLAWLRRDLAMIAPERAGRDVQSHSDGFCLGDSGRVRGHAARRVDQAGKWSDQGSSHRGERTGRHHHDARPPVGARAGRPHARLGEASLPDRGSAHALRAGRRGRWRPNDPGCDHTLGHHPLHRAGWLDRCRALHTSSIRRPSRPVADAKRDVRAGGSRAPSLSLEERSSSGGRADLPSARPSPVETATSLRMTRAGLEPATYGLKVRCSTS